VGETFIRHSLFTGLEVKIQFWNEGKWVQWNGHQGKKKSPKPDDCTQLIVVTNEMGWIYSPCKDFLHSGDCPHVHIS
jgi:hypothetical protein